mmetsp:Transcript_114929/g.245374  ORF Transcript_114929/g.245374 Transcript_114929/m.245374 type:complete len:206 (-) Transcript_114929:146-763(-)
MKNSRPMTVEWSKALRRSSLFTSSKNSGKSNFLSLLTSNFLNSFCVMLSSGLGRSSSLWRVCKTFESSLWSTLPLRSGSCATKISRVMAIRSGSASSSRVRLRVSLCIVLTAAGDTVLTAATGTVLTAAAGTASANCAGASANCTDAGDCDWARPGKEAPEALLPRPPIARKLCEPVRVPDAKELFPAMLKVPWPRAAMGLNVEP